MAATVITEGKGTETDSTSSKGTGGKCVNVDLTADLYVIPILYIVPYYAWLDFIISSV